MKKIFLVAASIVVANITQAQIYMGKTCVTHFFSKTSMKDIEASSNTAKPVLDAASGSFQMRIQNSSFKFESSFMQEHFNENYMESEKYPKSTFKGKITNLPAIKFDVNGVYNATVTGDITIHNVTKTITVSGTIEVKDGKIFAKAKFPVKTADYNIQIPKLVFKNIAETIDVTVDMAYTPYTK